MSRSTGFHESGKGVEGAQQALFHDTVADALGSAVLAIGGMKKAASMLWPADPISRSETRLRACLNAERAEKLSPDELIRLAKLAREAGDHSVMNYLAAELGYAIKPTTPEDELAALHRQYIEAAQTIARLAGRIERAQVRAV